MTEKQSEKDKEIIQEAKDRFKYCEEWESTARQRFVDDLKFANGDADNHYQWPDELYSSRDLEQRPCLTINKTRQHCLNIINDAKQNKPSVKIKPVGNEATYEASQVYEGVVRRIEYQSNAQAAYDSATSYQVQAGIGYWRIVTDFSGDDSFDQEIFIRRMKDPLCVYLDPDISEVDGSDAGFGFIFDDMPRDEFERQYPQYKDKVGQAALGNNDGWIDEDHVRVCEYYRRVEKKDRLMAMTDPSTGQQTIVRASKIPKEILSMVVDDPTTKIREICENEIEYFFIVGDEICDRTIWPGKYIPIVRVIGEETVIDGVLDRKGHTRAMKDPQRMYNYWTSAAAEQVALQGKSPYIAPARAIEGYETYWQNANKENYSVLPYNDVDDTGKEIKGPTRSEPAMMSTAYVEGMKITSEELMAVSGQYQADLGMPSNEKSGVAIQQRQRQGDNATYHFIDNLAIAIRFTGKILIDLIPKIYDTPRLIKIMAEDGVEHHVTVDPNAKAAYIEERAEQGEAIKSIFNPNVGKYDVEADIGPAYATRRQEAFNALSQIIAQSPELMKVAGDLLFKAADFPMAEEVAERLKKLVPSQLLEGGASPEVQALNGQIQQMQQVMQNLAQQLAEEKMKNKNKSSDEKIGAYDAITKRLDVITKHILTPKDAGQMLHDVMMEEHRTGLQADLQAQAAEQQPEPAQ
jgi:hypothetical protein